MTWKIVHEFIDGDTDQQGKWENVVVARQWTDDFIEQAAQKVKDMWPLTLEGRPVAELITTIRDFLPQPLRDAL